MLPARDAMLYTSASVHVPSEHQCGGGNGIDNRLMTISYSHSFKLQNKVQLSSEAIMIILLLSLIRLVRS